MKQKVAIEVLNPVGATEVKQTPAARIADLNGKTVCELWNAVFRGQETFPVIRELLKNQFPGVKIITYTEMPFGKEVSDLKEVGGKVKEKGCDAVIVGNAG